MSKYAKLEDTIRAFKEWLAISEAVEDIIADLPTIEVSEDKEIELGAMLNDSYKLGFENGRASVGVSGDCISREQFREQMYHRCFEVENDPNMQRWDSGNWIRWKLFDEELESAPSVLPKRSCYRCGLREDCEDSTERKPKEGEWIYCEDYVGHDGYKCSDCGFFIPWVYDYYADSNFILNYRTCPHCEARMKGAE